MAELTRMPILETGKSNGGFTLLEILAVIVLLGLVTMIVYPRFELNEEKTEALFIGRLITADIEMLRGEALAEREILTLHINKDGYDYKIGESTISRSFPRFEFKFAIPEEESKEDTGTEAMEEQTTKAEGEGPATEEPTGEEPTAEEPNVPEIEFSGEGSCSNLSMPWETKHFAGTLEVTENGEVKWTYAKKSSETKDSL